MYLIHSLLILCLPSVMISAVPLMTSLSEINSEVLIAMNQERCVLR